MIKSVAPSPLIPQLTHSQIVDFFTHNSLFISFVQNLCTCKVYILHLPKVDCVDVQQPLTISSLIRVTSVNTHKRPNILVLFTWFRHRSLFKPWWYKDIHICLVGQALLRIWMHFKLHSNQDSPQGKPGTQLLFCGCASKFLGLMTTFVMKGTKYGVNW